jgi:hypothetical protein
MEMVVVEEKEEEEEGDEVLTMTKRYDGTEGR